jgi:hypothetical protein
LEDIISNFSPAFNAMQIFSAAIKMQSPTPDGEE